MIRMANRSYTSSKGMPFFFIFVQLEWMDFGLPTTSASNCWSARAFFSGSMNSRINRRRSALVSLRFGAVNLWVADAVICMDRPSSHLGLQGLVGQGFLQRLDEFPDKPPPFGFGLP